MSTLNELKKMRRDYPNDQDFGAKVGEYISRHKGCCDKPENIIPFEDLNSHPYGLDARGTKCRKCGKVIDVNVTR